MNRGKWHLFRGTGEQRPILSGTGEQRQFWGTGNIIHYDNTPIQYTVIFHGCKNDYFQMKNCDIFLIFAPNIDSEYTLEPPH